MLPLTRNVSVLASKLDVVLAAALIKIDNDVLEFVPEAIGIVTNADDELSCQLQPVPSKLTLRVPDPPDGSAKKVSMPLLGPNPSKPLPPVIVPEVQLCAKA